MKIENVVIEKGNKGTDNIALNVEGVDIADGYSKCVRLYYNFDTKNLIGTANVMKKDGVLVATLILEDYDWKATTHYPAVKATSESDGRNGTVNKWTLDSVSLCISPNKDITIEPVKF